MTWLETNHCADGNLLFSSELRTMMLSVPFVPLIKKGMCVHIHHTQHVTKILPQADWLWILSIPAWHLCPYLFPLGSAFLCCIVCCTNVHLFLCLFKSPVPTFHVVNLVCSFIMEIGTATDVWRNTGWIQLQEYGTEKNGLEIQYHFNFISYIWHKDCNRT